MQLLRRDAYLRAETELAAVGKAGRGIDIHRRSVDTALKISCRADVTGDYRLTVTGRIAANMLDRLFYRRNNADGDNIIVILGRPILFGRGNRPR